MIKAYSLGLYEKSMPSQLCWKEKLEVAQKAEFDFIEISIDETDQRLSRLDWSKVERLEMMNLIKSIGLPIHSLCLSGHRKYPLGSSDAMIRARGLEIMEKAINLADDLGIRLIQLAGYDVYYEPSTSETKQWFLENLQKATHMAAKTGVVLGFETMETEFMNTVEKAMDYVELVSSVYLNVYPDIGNITNAAKLYQTDVIRDLELGKGNLAAMHLKESLPGIFREVPFGAGHVDFNTAIEAAWRLGVRKYVTEFWDTGKEDWYQDLVFANQMMTTILEQQR